MKKTNMILSRAAVMGILILSTACAASKEKPTAVTGDLFYPPTQQERQWAAEKEAERIAEEKSLIDRQIEEDRKTFEAIGIFCTIKRRGLQDDPRYSAFYNNFAEEFKNVRCGKWDGGGQ